MIIMISGSSGHIGSNLLNDLVKIKSFSFILLNNKKKKIIFKNSSRIKNVFLPLNADLRFLNKVKINYSDVNVFIHLAWPKLLDYSSDKHHKIGFLGSKKIIKFMISKGLKNIIITGTCFEYGLVYNGPVNEKMLSNPVTNCYAKSKTKLRKWLFEYQNKTNFQINWLVIFYLIDTNIKYKDNILSKLITSQKVKNKFYVKKPNFAHDFIKISMITNKIIKILLSNKYKGVINIGSGKVIRVTNLLRSYIKNNKLKSNIEFSKDDSLNNYFWSDNSKFNRNFN
jgi:nucleoside-diphosphate-sugar epimerase